MKIKSWCDGFVLHKITMVDVDENTIDIPVIVKAQQTNSKTNTYIFWYYSLPSGFSVLIINSDKTQIHCLFKSTQDQSDHI